MNSPGLQAGDQNAHTSPPPLAALRAASGGEKQGVSFLSPGLKAGAIHEFNIVKIKKSSKNLTFSKPVEWCMVNGKW
jgi:hypothetical protein